MDNFIPRPVLLRDVKGVRVEQSGGAARVGGVPASMTTRDEILANPIHYLRKVLASIMGKIESGEIVAIVHADKDHLGAAAPANGRPTYITITAEQFALGAEERARFAAWSAQVCGEERARQRAEREYDRGHNEGGEGYNPHRQGSVPTYRRGGR